MRFAQKKNHFFKEFFKYYSSHEMMSTSSESAIKESDHGVDNEEEILIIDNNISYRRIVKQVSHFSKISLLPAAF